jgi:hypothetical protein
MKDKNLRLSQARWGPLPLEFRLRYRCALMFFSAFADTHAWLAKPMGEGSQARRCEWQRHAPSGSEAVLLGVGAPTGVRATRSALYPSSFILYPFFHSVIGHSH